MISMFLCIRANAFLMSVLSERLAILRFSPEQWLRFVSQSEEDNVRVLVSGDVCVGFCSLLFFFYITVYYKSSKFKI